MFLFTFIARSSKVGPRTEMLIPWVTQAGGLTVGHLLLGVTQVEASKS